MGAPRGKVLSITGTGASTIGQTNPIRYRGYYYDAETGFYHLGSRYYDPVTHRFINADGYVSTGQGVNGTNMFAYCNNNPVNGVDPNGEYSIDPEEYRKMKEQYGKNAADGWARDAMAYMNAAEGKHALDMDESRHFYPEEKFVFSEPDFNSVNYTTSNWYYNLGLQYVGECTWYCYGRALELTGVKMPDGNGGQWYGNVPASRRGTVIRSRSVAVFKGLTPDTASGHVVFIEYVDYVNNRVYFTEANYSINDVKQPPGILYDMPINQFPFRYSNMELVGFVYTD